MEPPINSRAVDLVRSAIIDSLTAPCRLNGSVQIRPYDSDVEGMDPTDAQMIATFVSRSVVVALAEKGWLWANNWVDSNTGEPCSWMTPELEAEANAAYDEIEAEERHAE
jgi:hypothetical protein